MKNGKLTEEEKKIIQKIADTYSLRAYSYIEIEDLKAEIWLICLELLNTKKYKKTCGALENYLIVSVKNRLVNKFRTINRPVRSPCNRCLYFDKSNSGKYENNCKRFGSKRELCDKYERFEQSKESRLQIMNVTCNDDFERYTTSSVLDNMITDETIDKIRAVLPKELLGDFNKIINHEKVNKIKTERIIEAVKDILNIVENK